MDVELARVTFPHPVPRFSRAPPSTQPLVGEGRGAPGRHAQRSRGRASARAALGLFDVPAARWSPGWSQSALHDGFPRHDPMALEAAVRASHDDLAEVGNLVEAQPALACESWDCVFDDRETCLGAAAHSGRCDIAEYLMANGARPNISSAAMVRQLEVVRASLVGQHRSGMDARDHFDVDVRNDQLGLQRPGTNRRFLIHTGSLVFFPSGVPTVRIAFAAYGQGTLQLTAADPHVFRTARW